MVALAESHHVCARINLPYVYVASASRNLTDHVSQVVVHRIMWIMIGMVVVFWTECRWRRRYGWHRRLVSDISRLSGLAVRDILVIFVAETFVDVIFFAVMTFLVKLLFLASLVVTSTSVVVGKCKSGSGYQEEGEERANYQTSHGSEFFCLPELESGSAD